MDIITNFEQKLISKNITNIIVLCRGKSIEKFLNFKDKLNEKFCIVFVNKFEELKNYPALLERIKFTNTNMNIQFINNDYCNIEKNDTCNFFDVKYIQSNKKRNDLDSPAHLKYFENDKNYPKIFYIDDNTKDENYKLTSVGMTSIGYISTFKSIKNIYIFGLDFFECDYFSHHAHTGDKKVREYQPKKGLKAKDQFKSIVDKNKNINFYLYSYASFDNFDRSNFFIF